MKLSSCVTVNIPPESKKIDALSCATVSEESTHLVDPRGHCEMDPFVQAPRSKTLPDCVGLMDISKPGGEWFFDRMETLLRERGVKIVRRYKKPTFAKPCPPDLRQKIRAECQSVILALAD